MYMLYVFKNISQSKVLRLIKTGQDVFNVEIM